MINTVLHRRPSALKTDQFGFSNQTALAMRMRGKGFRRNLMTACVFGLVTVSLMTLGRDAGAQTVQNDNSDLPIQANTSTNITDDRSPKNQDLSSPASDPTFELEVLGANKSEYIDPASREDDNADYQSPNRRNKWDASTLTQSTGLGAASFYTQARPVSVAERTVSQNLSAHDLTDMKSNRAIDALSTEGLLDLTGLSQSIEDILPYHVDGVAGLGTGLRGSILDEQIQDTANGSVFRLGLNETLCLGPKDQCRRVRNNHIEMGFAKNITHGKRNGFNLQLTPRAGVRFNENSKSALVGALVRIGDNLRDTSAHMKSNAWYLFAGADAEAVRYNHTGLAHSLHTNEFHLQNRFFVGDAQAGFGYRFGDADLSLTYFKRQTNAENYRYDEDAAALSITWKR